MAFTEEKQRILTREDKSRKGSIDTNIQELCTLLNNHHDYVTTSSCSGRITLTAVGSRKNDTTWLYASHEHTITEDLYTLLDTPAPLVLLNCEGFIIHIKTATLKAAETLLKLVRERCKRSGIITIEPYPVIELIGTEHLNIPVVIDGEKQLTIQQFNKQLHVVKTYLKKNNTRLEKLTAHVQQHLTSHHQD